MRRAPASGIKDGTTTAAGWVVAAVPSWPRAVGIARGVKGSARRCRAEPVAAGDQPATDLGQELRCAWGIAVCADGFDGIETVIRKHLRDPVGGVGRRAEVIEVSAEHDDVRAL